MNQKYVWYAAYGSNLNTERFNCYILGGTPEKSDINQLGCRDKEKPRRTATYKNDHEMYFAKYSKAWGGGVCFIRYSDNDEFTLYKLYLVHFEQFIDVAEQECGLRPGKSEIDQENLESIKECEGLIFSKSWYGKILLLGSKGGYPIYTVTSPKDFVRQLKSPSDTYLYHIIKGLSESLGLNKGQIYNYLITKRGVTDGERLRKLIEDIIPR